MHFSYARFLENQIRKSFDFTGTPIHLIKRARTLIDDKKPRSDFHYEVFIWQHT